MATAGENSRAEGTLTGGRELGVASQLEHQGRPWGGDCAEPAAQKTSRKPCRAGHPIWNIRVWWAELSSLVQSYLSFKSWTIPVEKDGITLGNVSRVQRVLKVRCLLTLTSQVERFLVPLSWNHVQCLRWHQSKVGQWNSIKRNFKQLPENVTTSWNSLIQRVCHSNTTEDKHVPETQLRFNCLSQTMNEWLNMKTYERLKEIIFSCL